MKYNDNGEYKDIYIKTFDTLPVGAIVEYTGSTIPDGWTDIGNNQIQKTSQYIEGGTGLPSYFTTETDTGMKWIDDKKIYSKTLVKEYTTTIGATSTTTNISIAHNISNLDYVIKIEATISGGSGGGSFILPSIGGNASGNITASTVITKVDTTNVNLRIINDTWSSPTFYITIYYTKSS